MRLRSVDDLTKLGRRRLPKFLAEYVEGGSYSEQTLRKNTDDLARIELRQRVLHDVSDVRLETPLLGSQWSAPIGLGPVGISGMLARRGEVQAAIAAERAGIPFCLSTLSVCGIEEISEALERPCWFQLYVIRDRAFMADLLSRASEAACPVLVLTVDMPVPGVRYRDFKSGLSGSPGPIGQCRRFLQAVTRPAWLYDVGLRGRPHSLGNLVPVLGDRSGLNDCVQWIGRNFDPSTSWQDVGWIRDRWKGRLVIKGLLDVDDARRAAAAGVDGIVVSNHGGRQLDGAPSTVRALSPIADAVGDRLTVLADGGVRTGIDVLRMLALGARGVLLGRAWAYALAAGGQQVVSEAIETISRELAGAMAMAGCNDVSQLGPSVLASVG